jgi:hypothetical protein
MREGVVINIERNKNGTLPHMTPLQRRKAVALIKNLCCNYANSECIALDCKCPQCNTYSVCCKWFEQAILPQDKALFTEILEPHNKKYCVICGKGFAAKSNRAKYCLDCSVKERRIKKARNERRYRELKRGHLGL